MVQISSFGFFLNMIDLKKKTNPVIVSLQQLVLPNFTFLTYVRGKRQRDVRRFDRIGFAYKPFEPWGFPF